MIIYGDSHYESSFAALWAQLQNRFVGEPEGLPLDELRTMLILAGQWEQAVADAERSDLALRVEGVTDALSRLFFAAWSGDGVGDIEPVRRGLEALGDVEDFRVSVKVPEGFAYYALYPEQYIVAAQRWASEQEGTGKRAVVVGVRSIGTSLSALVRSVLEAEGWQVRRLTVRPSGLPFEREVDLGGVDFQEGERALVVDEGPGLSGSSMACVAEALLSKGVAREKIAFLPGHGGSPGQMGSEEVRRWWETAPRFVTAMDELRWHGQTLQESLAARTQELTQESVESVQDLGGGLWRRFVYPDAAQFPPVAPAFERPKFLCRLSSGEAVLWKFEGLAVMDNGKTGAESAFDAMESRAEEGWAPGPLATAYGFVATPWIEGRVPGREDVSADFLRHVAGYLVASAGGVLSGQEQVEALERMGEWLYWNTWEVLGEEFAERTRVWSERSSTEHATLAAYGDGRMAPYEWRVTVDGRYWKVDCTGHDSDHTVVGRQTLAWDVAGMVVEWGLEEEQIGVLLGSLEEAGGPMFEDEFLRFHYLGYAAYRLGLLAMARGSVDASEQERLQRGMDFYVRALQHWVE